MTDVKKKNDKKTPTHSQSYYRKRSKEKTNSLHEQSSLQSENKIARLFEEPNGVKIDTHYLSNGTKICITMETLISDPATKTVMGWLIIDESNLKDKKTNMYQLYPLVRYFSPIFSHM